MSSSDTLPSEELLKCPQCGANMELLNGSGKELAQCPYCGFSRVIEHEETKEEHDERIRRLMYEREKGRLKAQSEFEDEKNSRVKRGKRIALAIVLTPFVIGILAAIYTLVFGDPAKPTVDPFEGMEIVFSGADGTGEAKIKGTAGVDYFIEGNGSLSEGEQAVVTAKSGSYNLSSKSKTVTVEGLALYLTDLSMADEETLSVLRERAAEEIEKEFGATGELLSSATKHYESYEWKPIGLYLVTDGRTESHLFEAVELTFTRWGESVTEYAAYEFDGVLLHKSGVARVSWERDGFFGNTIQIGSMSEGSNPVWGTYMGAMTGFDSVSEMETSIRNAYAGLSKLQKAD